MSLIVERWITEIATAACGVQLIVMVGPAIIFLVAIFYINFARLNVQVRVQIEDRSAPL